MNTLDLTVIIPGFNTSPDEWSRCIDSVRNAIDTAKIEAEIICIDDGSSDGASFLDNRRDVKVIHQKNQGPSVSRNMGLAIAKGDYVSFVDSDDILYPDVYKLVFADLNKKNSDIVVFGVETYWPSIKLRKVDLPTDIAIGELAPNYLNSLQQKNLLNYVWNKIYKRTFLEENKVLFPENVIMGEDLIFNLDCAIKGAIWSSIYCIGYRYYRTKSTLLSRYKRMYITGLQREERMWKIYSEYAFKTFGIKYDNFLMLTTIQLETLEWLNIWKPHSPYSIVDKVKWLYNHPSVGGMVEFLKMFFYSFCRRYFYFNFVRRWHIKRLYPNVEEV